MKQILEKKFFQISLVLIPFLSLISLYETKVLSIFFSTTRRTYYQHVQLAFVMAETGKIYSPHFLYQFLVIGTTNLIFPDRSSFLLENYLKSGFLVSVIVSIALFILLFIIFRQVIKRNGIGYSILAAVMASFFMIGSAINALFFLDQHALFGYLPLNIYNSPTYTLLKLVSIPLFFLTIKIFEQSYSKRLWLVLGISFFTILSAISKPSFIVILLPSICVLAVYRQFLRKYVNWSYLLFGFLLPSAIVLGWQFFNTYGSAWSYSNVALALPNVNPTRIAFAPFTQFIKWEVPLDLLFPKLILSILFPLVVYLSYWKFSHKDMVFNFGWLLFIFGCLSTYLFVEISIGGNREGQVIRAGNFMWSGLIGVFVLSITAALFWLRQLLSNFPNGKSDIVRFCITFLAFLLHIAFGLIWYFDQLSGTVNKIY